MEKKCAGRNRTPSRKRVLIYIIFSMLLCIAVSRLLTLRHGLNLHPDEVVFFSSSSSLFFNRAYHLYKSYPEGAFIMQMPFQFLRQIALTVMHSGNDIQFFGAHMTSRLASVFYFSLGATLGCTLLYIIQKKTLPIVLFAVVMVFSLFQIEQSRYGTGEAPSFFLLMAMLNLIALYLRSNKIWLLIVAAFATGALGAVKYPQYYFILLPIGAAILNRKSSKTPLLINIGLILVSSVAGFICFSPSVLQPGFFMDAITRETKAYFVRPNIVSTGTPLNHLISLTIYHLFYADIPLAPVFAGVGLVSLFRQSEKSGMKFMFTILAPVIMMGFFLYNLFVPTLFFRTYYLYFCFFIVYASIGLAELFARKRMKQIAIALLCVMVIRGGYLMFLLTQPQKDAGAPLYTHEKWSEDASVTCTGWGFEDGDIPSQAAQISIYDAFITKTPTLEPGTFSIIGGYQYCIARSKIFEIKSNDVLSATNGWNSFREQNQQYLYHQLYPDYYYGLFGYWLEGSMGTLYEFPSVYYYYKPLSN